MSQYESGVMGVNFASMIIMFHWRSSIMLLVNEMEVPWSMSAHLLSCMIVLFFRRTGPETTIIETNLCLLLNCLIEIAHGTCCSYTTLEEFIAYFCIATIIPEFSRCWSCFVPWDSTKIHQNPPTNTPHNALIFHEHFEYICGLLLDFQLFLMTTDIVLLFSP